MRLQTWLETVLLWGARGLIALAALNLAAMMLHVIADVVMKYLFVAPIPGTAEIVAYYYMVAAVFLPLPLVELGNKAISVDLFWMRYPGWLQRITLFLAYLLTVTFFVILARQTSIDAMRAYAKGDLVEGIVPVLIWPGRFMLPASFWFAAGVAGLRALQVLLSSDWRQQTAQADGMEVS